MPVFSDIWIGISDESQQSQFVTWVKSVVKHYIKCVQYKLNTSQL